MFSVTHVFPRSANVKCYDNLEIIIIIKLSIGMVQKSVLLGTARKLRKFLDM